MNQRRRLLLLVLLIGSFQLGRLAERQIWPCRWRPLLTAVAHLLPMAAPDAELCELLLRLPG